MKLVSFEADGRASFGAVEGDKVIDLGPRMKDINGLENLLDPQSQARAADAAKGATADFNLDQIRFRRPIAYPEKIVCIGVNYANRGAEYNDDSTPTYPSVFLRSPETLVAHNEPLLLPPESVQLDYEAEIAIIIGEGGRRIPTDNALDHIAAVTCLNEGCIRDWMRHGKFNVTQGKNFDACGSVGPWMVTVDEFADGYDDMRVTGRVNDEVRQDDTTANIIFDFTFLINYVSTWTSLKKGDIISTGTPTGAGARFDPPKWLKAGDTVEIEVEGVGILRNPVIDEV
ncbi:MAG: fumarylacetoacetate hydrolase family protein [Pseudomonadota bacterium]|nr:fumarylacetoacetate hydrolase family protein [Pseudomonadota bacterium]